MRPGDIPPDNILLSKGTHYPLMMGYTRIPIPADAEGINLEYFSGRLKKKGNTFTVVMPELSPPGRTMSIRRRKELYHLCYTNAIPIIELDEYRGCRIAKCF